MRRTIILNDVMFPSLLAVPLSVRSHVKGLCSTHEGVSHDDALRLQDGIDNIVRWCADNNLFLNCAKSTKKTEPLLFNNYSINGTTLPRSNSV
jgi:hypothetical protein